MVPGSTIVWSKYLCQLNYSLLSHFKVPMPWHGMAMSNLPLKITLFEKGYCLVYLLTYIPHRDNNRISAL